MAKTWRQILEDIGKVPPEQFRRDKREMLEEKGMTWAEFTATEEWKEMATRAMHARFNNPGISLEKPKDTEIR